MDSLLTGYKEILFIQTKSISLTIKGITKHTFVEANEEEPSSVGILSKENFSVSILNKELLEFDSITKLETKPLFYEQQRYEIIIESLNNSELNFWHENKSIRNSVSPISRNSKSLSGIINFGNDIGLSDLVIYSGDVEILRITVEVFPSKISYSKDYKALVQDVMSEMTNLVFDFMRNTYQQLGLSKEKQTSLVEFFTIIEKIFADMYKSLNIIINNPHHILQTYREVVPAYKAKHIDNRSIRWLQNHPNLVNKKESHLEIERVLDVRKSINYDTKENQFLKYILQSTCKKLNDFEDYYAQFKTEPDPIITNKISTMIGKLRSILKNTFLNDVSSFSQSSSMSLVFSMAPGYRDIYKYYLMLQHGLSFTGNMFNLSIKNIAVLYEYWCFIKLNSLIRDKYELISQDIVKINTNGLFVTLTKGNRSTVKYRNPRNGELITLSYNEAVRDTPTVPQKPDNVLCIEKKDGKNKYEYVFDAKYRIDPAEEGSLYKKWYKKPGPPEDTINTMHRYRDAIVYRTNNLHSPFERTMFGAYVLFPYTNEEEYKSHQFYESIKEVNVGGLPFLPSTTTLVSDFLDELIEDSPESSFERATLPMGIEEKLRTVDWDKKDVLIGVLRDREQLQTCLDHNFYHLPATDLPDDKLPIHYVAIYQSQKLFPEKCGVYLYGEVIRCSIVYRKEITERKYTHNPNELFYKLEVKEWKELEHPIGKKEFGPPTEKYTNLFLLENSTIYPELFFKSEEEFRIYNEIKYHIKNEERTDGLGFNINNKFVLFENGKIKITDKKTVEQEIDFKNFVLYPNMTFKKIMELCK